MISSCNQRWVPTQLRAYVNKLQFINCSITSRSHFVHLLKWRREMSDCCVYRLSYLISFILKESSMIFLVCAIYFQKIFYTLFMMNLYFIFSKRLIQANTLTIYHICGLKGVFFLSFRSNLFTQVDPKDMRLPNWQYPTVYLGCMPSTIPV